VDVVLLARGGLAIAAVEVRNTHAVDDLKRGDLALPWIEVDAAQVCASGGRLLVPVQDRFLPWLCPEHAPTRRDRARAERDEPRRRAALLRSLPFRLDAFPGLRGCRRGLPRRPRRSPLHVAGQGLPMAAPAARRRARAALIGATAAPKAGGVSFCRGAAPCVSVCPACGAPVVDAGSCYKQKP
jgi:hypothetical protein